MLQTKVLRDWSVDAKKRNKPVALDYKDVLDLANELDQLRKDNDNLLNRIVALDDDLSKTENRFKNVITSANKRLRQVQEAMRQVYAA